MTLQEHLRNRLRTFELKIKNGIIPGELDTYEHHQLLGRIKEIKALIMLVDLTNPPSQTL